MFNTNNNELKFYTANNERMIIDRSGNVGIGTNTPNASYKLDVSGAIKSGGQILIDGGNSYDYFTGMATNTTVFQGDKSTQLRANNGDLAFYANSSSDSP